ncbi:putative zinc finger protein [Abeliophyllum distichum]|uniref:Zinc finger protein n=1 Tax=Abeliophyllum distichum TaxID=126358 RepID=A0ABD1U1X0_9LAMI
MAMDNICEFCMALRPLVYCKSDAARLCLSCDAKVHSANALSNRHPRTLVCEACRRRPVYVRCFDHEMFMCRSCDNNHHASSQHQKKVVRSYVGCPSAMHLAALWGFDLNELENKSSFKDQYVFASVTADSETEEGSSSQQTEVVKDDNQQKNTCMILQQILDLKRLQLSEGSDNSCLVRGKGKTDQSSFKYDTISKVQMEYSLDQHYELQYMGSPHEEMPEESFLSQLGHLISTENPLQGDTFWQCKSPTFSNELWPQNMQDIGVCDQLQCFDDLHIPDVDLTFQKHSSFNNPESLRARTIEVCISLSCHLLLKYFKKFQGLVNAEKRVDINNGLTNLAFQNYSFSLLFWLTVNPVVVGLVKDEKKLYPGHHRRSMLLGASFVGGGRFNYVIYPCFTVALRWISHRASSACIVQSADANKLFDSSDQVLHFRTINEYPRPIQPSYSASSFSVSRITAESSSSEYKDDGLFPKVNEQILLGASSNPENAKLDGRVNVIMRSKEKKKALWNEKRHSPHKAKSDSTKRGEGKLSRAEAYESDSVSLTRSF